MNIAFSAIVLFVLVLPGILFRKSISTVRRFRRRLPVTEEFAYSIGFAAVIHAIAAPICNAFSSRLLDVRIDIHAEEAERARARETRALRVSGNVGLLLVPLPSGARLVDALPGSAFADPREEYQIQASVSEITAFYRREMPGAGWGRVPPYTSTALFFQKGQQEIGILMSRNAFTLIGS